MKQIKIGDDIWAAENLSAKNFRNGEPILHAQSDSDWEKAAKEKIPAWCFYDENPSSEKKYGLLYNAHAVQDPRGLAPEGWHIPTKEDWEGLAEFKCKKKSPWKAKKGWSWENGDDELGFSALPGGHREKNFGMFMDEGEKAYWWSASSTPGSDNFAEYVKLENDNFQFDNENRGYGFSVRCMKGDKEIGGAFSLCTFTVLGRGYEIYSKMLRAGTDPVNWCKKNSSTGEEAYTDGILRLTRFDENFHILIEGVTKSVMFPILEEGKKILTKEQLRIAKSYESKGYKVIKGVTIVNRETIDLYTKEKTKILLAHDYSNTIKFSLPSGDNFDPKSLRIEIAPWKQKVNYLCFVGLAYKENKLDAIEEYGSPKMGYEGPWLVASKSLKEIK